MRWNWLLTGLAALVLVILVLSWIAGGPEELSEIAQPVAVPELPR